MPKKLKTKRRKIVKRDCIDDIPYSKYRVEWVDCVSDSGWAASGHRMLGLVGRFDDHEPADR